MRPVDITVKGKLIDTILVDDNASDKEINEKVYEYIEGVVEWQEV